MLNGAPIEEPFSILSVSIEHPLQPGGNKEGRREENGELGELNELFFTKDTKETN